MSGMAENIHGSVDNMTMTEFLFHQSMIFTTNCFDGLEETYFCLISSFLKCREKKPMFRSSSWFFYAFNRHD